MHSTQMGCNTIQDKFSIIGREDHGLARTKKESILVRVNNPTFNRNVGKYNLHHIWDRVLSNTHDLKISNNNGHAYRITLSGHAHSILTNRHLGLTGHALKSEHAHRTS